LISAVGPLIPGLLMKRRVAGAGVKQQIVFSTRLESPATSKPSQHSSLIQFGAGAAPPPSREPKLPLSWLPK
jgi:hypothetical protein